VTLAQGDLSDLLDPLRAGGDLDIVRKSVELILEVKRNGFSRGSSGKPGALQTMPQHPRLRHFNTPLASASRSGLSCRDRGWLCSRDSAAA
jgi:hypothetical protein